MKKDRIFITHILPILVSVLALASSCIIGGMQIQLSKRQAALEEIFKPLNYTVEPSESKCLYTFGDKQVEQFFPNIRFVTGRPRQFAVIIVQDGQYAVASCDISPAEEYYIGNIKTGMPITDFEAGTRYAYDYFFIYFEDATGQETLDMIYYQIDIQNAAITGPKICSKIDLIELEGTSDPYKKEMLSRYSDLLGKMRELPDIQ